MTEPALRLPVPNRVFQQNRNGTATISFECLAPVRARVVSGKKTVVPWRRTAGTVPGVPAGGPYTLEIETGNGRHMSVGGLLVGDLWILAGQSNMDGCGKLLDLEPPSRMVHNFYYSEQWDVARDPLCVLVDSIDPVHWPCEEEGLEEARGLDHQFRETGAGLGVRFGKDVYKATGVPIGLIACSHGGTSIEQWDPKLKRLGGRSLYGSMYRRVQACGGGVTGVLWYQGESNGNPETCRSYKKRMKTLIQAFRNDFNNPRLPFIQAQLSRFFVDETEVPPGPWNHVQQVQLDLAAEIPRVATVAAIDGVLSDAIHLDAASCRRMGARMAEMALVLVYGKKAPRELRPGKITLAKDGKTVRITYRNVRGALKPATGIRGFRVQDAVGDLVPIATTRTARNAVTLQLARPLHTGAILTYGHGLNPTANLEDTLLAAPVFGPVTL